MSEPRDIAVIGAGIVGVSTALHLLMRGRRVTLIEGHPEGAGRETSYGNSGIVTANFLLPYAFPSFGDSLKIVRGQKSYARIGEGGLVPNLRWFAANYWHSQPETRRRNGAHLTPLVRNAIAAHKELMQGTDAAKHLSLKGEVIICRTEADFKARALEIQVAEERGVPYEVLSPEEFAKREPNIIPNFYKALCWTSSARLDNPGAVVAKYAERFRHERGEFISAHVNTLEQVSSGAWAIHTAMENIGARQVVVCAGPWSGDLLRTIGYRFPLAFKRGYHLHFKPQGNAKLSHVLIDSAGGVLAPMEQGLRLTTGAEFAALHAPPSPEQLDAILPSMRELFPLGERLEQTPWMGSRPCFADFMPVIGPAPRHEGLWFNFGHGHLGMTEGPESGRLLAEMIVGERPFCDPAPFSANRFGMTIHRGVAP
jgi:D-amino-acid dehydrogenase